MTPIYSNESRNEEGVYDLEEVIYFIQFNSTVAFFRYHVVIYEKQLEFAMNCDAIHCKFQLLFVYSNFLRNRVTRGYLDVMIPFQHALERALFKYKQAYSLNASLDDLSALFELNVNTIDFPHPALISVDVVGQSGPAFFLGCLMFNFVIQMGQLVTEKELRLREAMTVVGLSDWIYWTTWIITNICWNTLSGLLLILAGSVCLDQHSVSLRQSIALA